MRSNYPEAQGLGHLTIEVEDIYIGKSVRKLEKKGDVVEPVHIDGGTGRRSTLFSDPDGLPLELYERG